jgi:hypothetical protein
MDRSAKESVSHLTNAVDSQCRLAVAHKIEKCTSVTNTRHLPKHFALTMFIIVYNSNKGVY